jgi:hydrogenase maturation protein HypF
MTDNRIAKRLKVKGIVQGVGFRPFVFQLATHHDLKGEVANTASGVSIHIEGRTGQVNAFEKDLATKGPPLASVFEISSQTETVQNYTAFVIVKSKNGSEKTTLISPDASVCNECLKEMFDPDNRRYRYPFINCTNCGPRYTIIDDIPYDRPNTSMRRFKMCGACQAEYDNPEDRRFHAQPNACATCGPLVTLYENRGRKIDDRDPIEKTAQLLTQGNIVAIKGLGGFHLAVDAENSVAVARLRRRKQREEKPFAIMSIDIEKIQTYAHVSPEEQKLLTSPQRPIVLLKKKTPHSISPEVAPRNKYFGTMLPYTPLHYLLLNNHFTAIVMTSGNLSEEPIAIDNGDAFERLRDITDYFLIHNRDIYLRSDDSVIRRSGGATQFMRRSRGFVPMPVFLNHSVPQILACGAELKNTVCLTKDNTAFLSQHIGDLENLATYDFFKWTTEHMKRILDIHPEIIAYDLHPDYLSTRYAEEQQNIVKIQVQHHHAHIAGCMAENSVDGPVIGLSFDGTGYGSDGNLWGGEILIAEAKQFTRAAHLAYVSMPGGATAVKEPWRMAVSYLYNTLGDMFWNLDLPIFHKISKDKIKIIVEMIAKKINSPLTSSLGRLFDGIAAIIGLRNRVHFEGQAAMELEMIADEKISAAYDWEWTSNDIYHIRTEPIIRGVLHDVEKGVPPSQISSKFHMTLIHLFTALCDDIRKNTGLNQVALSGGVFQNSLLFTGLLTSLENNQFEVYTHHHVPPNDGGISLGQAVVAAATITK